jgi:hypothetical protein
MARGNAKPRATSVITAAALGAVMMPVLVACSSGGSGDPGASVSPSTSASSSAKGAPTADATEGASDAQSSGGGQPTARQAVTAFLTDLLNKDYKQVCSETAEPASKGQPAQVAPPTMCADKKMMSQMSMGLDAYRTTFTPKGASGTAKVEVDEKPVKGKTATWFAKEITVDGQRLNKIIFSHTKGVKPGQMHTTIEAVQVNGSWYSGAIHVVAPGFNIS